MRWRPDWPPACRLQKYRFRSKVDGEAMTHCRLHGGHGSLHVFAAGAADVTDVVIDGRPVVVDRAHVDIPDVGAALGAAIEAVLEAR